ncbi:hypothetical protein LTR70_010639, partial [Exophiala xenobiotica]
MVTAESRRGKIEVVARVGDIQVGQVFTPIHYGYFDNHDGRARAANELTQERWDLVSKQPMFKSGAVRIGKIPPGEVKVHTREQHSETVRKLEDQRSQFPGPGDVHKHEKLGRILEYWLGATATSFDTLQDICDHVVPRVEGADFEIGAGMRVMHRITTACLTRLKPITQKYNIDERLGHNISTGLKDRLFPDAIVDFTGSPSYDVLIMLQGFYLFLGYIEAHMFALQPTSQAAWDKDFNGCVEFLTQQLERMKAWTKQQMHSRGPQTLLVPCRQAVGLRERVERKAREGEESAV